MPAIHAAVADAGCFPAEHSEASGKFLVRYDDGDEEWVDLAAVTFKWVDRAALPAAKRAAAGAPRSFRLVKAQSQCS